VSLTPGTLRRRYQRFFAEVELDDGTVVVAHCANPGSMKGCAAVGDRVWLSRSDNPARKLAWTWELVLHDHGLVCVNTAVGNRVVGAALAAGAIAEVAGYPELTREVTFGASRIDFRLARGPRRRDELWLEVKTATMHVGAGVVAFPDAVSTRALRHVGELVTLRRRGARAMLLFCVARAGAVAVRPADEIDPAYGAALRAAITAGVEVVAYGCEVGVDGVTLTTRLPVIT